MVIPVIVDGLEVTVVYKSWLVPVELLAELPILQLRLAIYVLILLLQAPQQLMRLHIRGRVLDSMVDLLPAVVLLEHVLQQAKMTIQFHKLIRE